MSEILEPTPSFSRSKSATAQKRKKELRAQIEAKSEVQERQVKIRRLLVDSGD